MSHLRDILLVAEWENNGDVAVENTDELSDEVEIEREVDHCQDKGTSSSNIKTSLFFYKKCRYILLLSSWWA